MPDGKVDVMLGQKNQWTPAVGAELALAFHPEWQALRDWNNAAIGVALSYWKLDATRNGDKDLLGHAIAPYVFLEVPFYKSKHFEIGVRPGIGCSFITKNYFNTATPEQQYQVLQAPNINRSVGSVFNFYFPEALYCAFPIRNGWSVNIAAGWYHMSNGSLRQPNSGYNIFSGEIGVRYESPKQNTPPCREGMGIGLAVASTPHPARLSIVTVVATALLCLIANHQSPIAASIPVHLTFPFREGQG